MVDVLRGVSTRQTPQSQPAGGATVKNAAGGYVFGISDLARVKRFLTLGTEGGTYYTKPADLTRENAEAVIRMATSDPVTLVDTLVEISLAGRAPRQNPAIFALAIAASVPETPELRAYALAAIPKVCRTATHLYLFQGYTKQFRGRGPALNGALRKWYLDKDVDKLAYQALKYRQREGWSHRDMLRLVKPVPNSPERDALFAWIVGKRDTKREALPALVVAFEQAQNAVAKQTWINLIETHDLSWEMLPDEALGEALVWEALIAKGMPQTALMRQLPRLTKLGLCTGATGKRIATQLADPVKLKQGRVHPINVLVAQRTYASGASARSMNPDARWTPSRMITDALDAAFYAAYGAVEPSGKRILLACDVSGSMGSPASGLPLNCREAVAALTLVSLNVEQDCEVIGFSDGQPGRARYGWGGDAVASRLDISPRRRLDDVCRYMSNLPFGRTDCALPMIWAMQNKVDVDAIWTLTDSETWYGKVHPHQALKQYREHVGHDVRYGVVAMTATGQSIADPKDPQSMDISGFDSNVPQVISAFSAGLI